MICPNTHSSGPLTSEDLDDEVGSRAGLDTAKPGVAQGTELPFLPQLGEQSRAGPPIPAQPSPGRAPHMGWGVGKDGTGRA